MKTKQEQGTALARYSPLVIPEAIARRFRMKRKLPVCLLGAPSTAKTQLIKASARAEAEIFKREFVEWNAVSEEKKLEVKDNPKGYFCLWTIHSSESDMTDAKLPDLNGENKHMDYKYYLPFVVASHPDAMGILFFDEFNHAEGAVKKQFYKVINDRQIGDMCLSDNILCVMAQNEHAHSRGLSKDDVALTTRRINIFLREQTSDEGVEYLQRTGGNPFVCAFIDFIKKCHDLDYKLPDSVGQMCMRTLEFVSDVMNENKGISRDDLEMEVFGAIGQGYGTEFMSFYDLKQEIDIDAIFANPNKIREYETHENISLLYAICSAGLELYQNDKRKYFPKLVGLILAIKKEEFGAFVFRSLKLADENMFMRLCGELEKDTKKALVEKYGKFLMRNYE